MKKITALLAVFILLFSFSAMAQASEIKDITKDETVYINLDSNGSVKEILVVNHIDTPTAGTYIDYGNYSSIDNITGKEVPEVEGDKITWELPAYEDGFYYIGTLKDGELPWNFSISYFLDNKKVEAADLGGVDGKVKILITAAANSKAEEYFKNNFAMQLSLTLDTDICKNINAPDATMVLAGKSMTISYTALPGSDINATVSFDAKDLTLSGLSVIFSPFSMDSYGSLDQIDDSVNTMLKAMDALISGTKQLQNGMTDLSDGVEDLNTGSAALASGSDAIDSGMRQYADGLNTFSGYISSFAAEMTNSLNALEDAGNQLEKAKTALSQSSKKIETAIAGLEETSSSYSDQIEQLENGLKSLSEGLTSLNNNMTQLTELNDNLCANLTAITNNYKDLANSYSTNTDNLKAIISDENAALAQSIINDPNESENAKNLAAKYLDAKSNIDVIAGNLTKLNSSFTQYNTELSGNIENIKNNYVNINTTINSLQTMLDGMIKGLGDNFDFSTIKNQLLTLKEELDNAGAILAGFSIDDFNIDAGDYKNGINQMQGAVNQLTENFELLHAGISNGMIKGVKELNTGINLLYENVKELPTNVGKLASGQEEMKNGISGAIDDLSGAEETTDKQSFAAPGRMIPNTIQFIGTTPTIEPDTTVYEEPEPETDTFWQRIKNLFS